MPQIAAIQMCSTAEVDENLAIAARLIQQAAEQGAHLIVLPEMFSIMGKTSFDKRLVQETFGQGKTQDFLSLQAERHGVWIVGGTIPIRCDDPRKVRAACLVYDAKGKVVARYDKAHLFDAKLPSGESYLESETTEAGDELIILQTPFGKLGLAVCYDLRFGDMFLEFLKQGVEIIAVPTAFTETTGKAHWQALLQGRAIESFAYVAGACQYGLHASGRTTYGHSMIVDPWGNKINEIASSTEGLACSEIDLEYLYQKRASIPVAEHLKEMKYQGILNA